MAQTWIDVSVHQGKIDWAKVKKYIDGAIIRIGYGDDLKKQDDAYAEYNMSECERLGIPYDVYIYSYASSEKQNQSEVAHTKRVVGNHSPLNYWLDLEERSLVKNWKAAAEAWINAFGEAAGVYTWQEYFSTTLAGLKCKRWICRYGTNSGKPEYKYKPSIEMDGWQYTSRAMFDGIKGYVDASEFYSREGATDAKVAPGLTKQIITKKMVATEIMKHLCTHNTHGYTQDMTGRQGTNTEAVEIYGKIYLIPGGDRDCSSAVISAYEAAGISCGGATYTGNMRSKMVATGNFKWHDMSFVAQAGDTYLNEKNHTAMCLSAEPDVLMEFSINENGGTLGGQIGDQKQSGEYDETYGRGESHLRKYYNYPWNGILECINDEVAFVIDNSSNEIIDSTDDTVTEVDNKEEEEMAKQETTKLAGAPYLEKTDNELAIEVLFGVHGSGEKRKKKLGTRYDVVQKDVNFYWEHVSDLIQGIKSYIKVHGAEDLAK